MNNQNLVRQFHEAFGVDSPDKPTMPSLEIRKLRARLIMEEAMEAIRDGLGLIVEASIEDCGANYHGTVEKFEFTDVVYGQWDDDGAERRLVPSLVELADGLADLQYVTLGAAIACGLDMEPIFVEVHRSNMSKAWTDEELKDIGPFQVRKSTGGRHAVVRQDGKIIKSPSYSPANLKPIIEHQINAGLKTK